MTDEIDAIEGNEVSEEVNIDKVVIGESDNADQDSVTNSIAFVSEEDLFSVEVECYKEDGFIVVRGIDDEYDTTRVSEKIEVKFKCPDQGDARLIQSQTKLARKGEFSVEEVMDMEFTRILVLIRDWNLKAEVTHENVLKMHPKIIKSLVESVRERIKMDGLI